MTNKRKVKYPHLREAACNMGYDFSYIWRVLEGKPGFPGRQGLADEFWKESARLTQQKAKERKAK